MSMKSDLCQLKARTTFKFATKLLRRLAVAMFAKKSKTVLLLRNERKYRLLRNERYWLLRMLGHDAHA